MQSGVSSNARTSKGVLMSGRECVWCRVYDLRALTAPLLESEGVTTRPCACDGKAREHSSKACTQKSGLTGGWQHGRRRAHGVRANTVPCLEEWACPICQETRVERGQQQGARLDGRLGERLVPRVAREYKVRAHVRAPCVHVQQAASAVDYQARRVGIHARQAV